MQTPIYSYTFDELVALMSTLKQPEFRARQLFEWLYCHGALSYEEMTNLPHGLRKELSDYAPLFFPRVRAKHVSADGARKYVLELFDGNLVETVGIPQQQDTKGGNSGHLSVCFSTQVGCAMRCSFCATGQEGYRRNLEPGEIVSQLLVVAKDFEQRVSSAVGMGQGEPFLNYRNTTEALRIMNNKKALGIGARHLVVSTCGICEGIRQFAHEPEQFGLAISLHSAIQEKRNLLMPGMAATPLIELKKTLVEYQRLCGRRITLEYMLIDGVNSLEEDLRALKDFCEGLSVYVNLLYVNAVKDSPLRACPKELMHAWEQNLGRNHIPAAIRASRGSDIQGGCGQLKNSLAQNSAAL